MIMPRARPAPIKMLEIGSIYAPSFDVDVDGEKEEYQELQML
jgi:hypothetical protein